METNQAAENLQVIRTLMERSALYRRALAPIMLFAGIVGTVAGIANWLVQTATVFIMLWAAAAVVAVVGSLLLVRRQAVKDADAFWSPPTRRIALAMMPSLVAGLVISVCLFISAGPASGMDILFWLPAIWAILYGSALHAAGFFTPSGVRVLGWVFLSCGSAILLLALVVDTVALSHWTCRFFMGIVFGGLHLAAGIYLYFTEQRKNVA